MSASDLAESRRYVLEGNPWDLPKESVESASLVTTIFLSKEEWLEKRVSKSNETIFSMITNLGVTKNVLNHMTHEDFEEYVQKESLNIEHTEFIVGDWVLYEFRNGVVIGDTNAKKILPPGEMKIKSDITEPLLRDVRLFFVEASLLKNQDPEKDKLQNIWELSSRMIKLNAALEKGNMEVAVCILPDPIIPTNSSDGDEIYKELLSGARKMLAAIVGTVRETIDADVQMNSWVLRESSEQMKKIFPIVRNQIKIFSNKSEGEGEISFTEAVWKILDASLEKYFMLNINFSDQDLDLIFDITEGIDSSLLER